MHTLFVYSPIPWEEGIISKKEQKQTKITVCEVILTNTFEFHYFKQNVSFLFLLMFNLLISVNWCRYRLYTCLISAQTNHAFPLHSCISNIFNSCCWWFIVSIRFSIDSIMIQCKIILNRCFKSIIRLIDFIKA